jgi:hypothetical protein
MTLEDPVEYQISGVNQVQINPGQVLRLLRHPVFLRQDPNMTSLKSATGNHKTCSSGTLTAISIFNSSYQQRRGSHPKAFG